MILKPIPARSDYPFDPDNPVPNGTQLNPAELRAKYYKVIKPESRFYSGDARLMRDRRAERDPKRTTKFKLMRADGQEFNEGTKNYLIDDVVGGRWFGKKHANETRVEVDYEALSKKPCFKYDHDMFSIISNKYGREYNPDRGPPKKDFISMNAKYAKYGGTMPKPVGDKNGNQRKQIFSTVAKPTREDLWAACNTLVDADAAPFMLRWLESQATNGDRISFMKAFQALSKSTSKKPSAHQKAIAHAQTLRRMIKAGIPAEAAVDRGAVRSHSAAEVRRKERWDEDEERQLSHQFSIDSRHMETGQQQQAGIPVDADQKRPWTSGGTKKVPNQLGTFRPSTAYINTMPMPPEEGEVPPADRRHAGVYPFDWKPRPRVQELKDKLQEILSTKHKHLAISFRRFDEDHHGTVDLNELYRVMVVESGLKCTRAELEEVWDLFDRDRDGVVKYADYSKTMGNDALDERDYFQIAQRKAAGRYNEEVKFFADKEEETSATKTQADDPNSAVNLNLKERFHKHEEGVDHGHMNLFSLDDKKVGALFNEKFKKNSHTVENTHAHNLRLELAAEIVDKFDTLESAFEHYTEGPGLMSEHYFSLMVEDLGLKTNARTIHELFSVYDHDLDGKLDVDNFVNSFDLQRQASKKDDVFFQDVVLTDVPKHKSHKKAKPKYEELEHMLLPKHAKKELPGKLIPARTRTLNRGAAKRQPADRSYEHRDLPVSGMLPPRPLTALSASGGFDFNAPNLQQRAATPLQQLQNLQKISADVRDNTLESMPMRSASTPPVPGPRAVSNDRAPSALASSMDMANRPRSSVPKGVATDFKIRPQTAMNMHNSSSPAQMNRPRSVADDRIGEGPGRFGMARRVDGMLNASMQPGKGVLHQSSMRPMSAGDNHFAPVLQGRADANLRPLSAAVPAMWSGNEDARGVFAQER